MNSADKNIIVALASVDGIGAATLFRLNKLAKKLAGGWLELWQRVGNPTGAEGYLKPQQLVALTSWRQKYTPDSFSQSLASKKIDTLWYEEESYPELLRHCPHPPAVLFYMGVLNSSPRLPIAIVGTRHITSYGKMATQKLVSELGGLDAVIISGFMYGVDILAHQEAMIRHVPSIAVLGFGLEQMYPARQVNFFQEFIAAGNWCVSEYAPHVLPQPGNFPARNRIVAGLSRAVVVIEGAKGSGSLITAQHALEANRTVCAVPGPITSPYSEGTKWLINQGAVMVSSGRDIIDEILSINSTNLDSRQVSNTLPPELTQADPLTLALYKELQINSQSADDLAITQHLSISQVLNILSLLELDGLINRDGEVWQIVS